MIECPHVNSLNSRCVRALPTTLECSDCKKKTESLWMCLTCGVTKCGRYEDGHAELHYKNTDHSITFDCVNLTAYCYLCDEYVINDTKSRQINQIISKFKSGSESGGGTPTRTPTESSEVETRRQVKEKYCKQKLAGLRNLGNTCFMNAVLQSLSNVHQFSSYFIQLPALDSRLNGSNGDNLAEELRKVLVALADGGKSSISPDQLFHVVWKVVPRFRGYQQQDAHEFLRYVLDRLHTELGTILPFESNQPGNGGSDGRKQSVVTALFGGVLQNEVNCLACNQDSKKLDPFLDLSLDIPQANVHKSARLNDSSAGSQRYTLHDCLASFTELEELAETELYLCSNCKSKQRSTKKFWIKRLPNVLCLHLKRFRWNNYFRTKVDTMVDFPLKSLDMSKYVLPNVHETRGNSSGGTLYDLAAAVIHHGSGAGSGHYTAYGMHDGCWHHFNDSTVTMVDENTVASCKAYILFYIRRELNLANV